MCRTPPTSAMGHSRRFGFVRIRHCGHEFLRQGRDGQKRMWTRRTIALTLVGDHSGEDRVRTAVTGPAAVALVFWCIASFLVADALAASLERVEFEGASKPLTRGDRIQGFLAKPDGTAPFPLSLGCTAVAGCTKPRNKSWPTTLLPGAMSPYSSTALQR